MAEKGKPGKKKPVSEGRANSEIGLLLAELDKAYPAARCALHFTNPLELLVATILSAQCTDERVNQVTRELFKKYRTAADYAGSPAGVLETEIRSTGFFNNKARAIRGAGAAIRDRFGGKVPRDMESLLTLPGVARKTAGVVLGSAFGLAEGLVVDTHVSRVTRRLGLTSEENPEKIEKDLMALIPRERWIAFSLQVILHGRRICKARKPSCPICPVAHLCPSRGMF